MFKVIFLDFDGVLNNNNTLMKRNLEWNFTEQRLSLEWWADGLNRSFVRLINEIIDRTMARVVVSSSWRIGVDKDWLQTVLKEAGFTSSVFGKTPYLSGAYRHKEIMAWIENHGKVDRFVILDDDWNASIEGHFLKTKSDVGLTVRHVEKAVAILGECNEQKRSG